MKTAFFFKLRKIAQRLRASPSDPVCDMFELQYTFFTQHVSQFRHFHILTIGFKPSPLNEFLVTCQHRQLLLIFYSTISLPPQKIPLSKFLMTSLHVICGLPPPPPNQKSCQRLRFLVCSKTELLTADKL